MRTLALVLLLALPLFVIQAQDDGYTMYETIVLEPETEDLAGLMEAMAEHNKTYHNEGAYSAIVWQIATGPNAGKLVWMMGPCTYTDLDGRPAGEHDTHWANEVMPHIESGGPAEYWRRDDDLSHTDGQPRPIVAIRYLEIEKGQGYRLQGLLQKLSDAVGASDDDTPWSVYYNEFQQGWDIGRHIALVSGLNTWSEFDKPDTFVQDFEKHHGENTWQPFLREWQEVIHNSWDEVWTIMPALTGPDNN